MNIEDAKKVVEQAWPGQGVTLSVKGSVHEVVAKDGTVLGRAFGWQPALREAVKPLLQAAQLQQAKQREEQEREFGLFMQYLRESLGAGFLEWRAKREAAPAADPSAGVAQRTEPDQGKLVQLVRP